VDVGQGERDLRSLASDIIHCELLAVTLGGRHTPCRDVVSWQGLDQDAARYVPEPWRGHIGKAAILFVSSNPSAGAQGEALDPNWWGSLHDDEDLFTSFEGSFDPGPWPGVADAIYCRDEHGRRIGSWVRYWSWTRQRAAELLGRQPVPGHDYALTEVVHCACRHEYGVATALNTCTARYLHRILQISAAKVIVVVGRTALHAFQDATGAYLDDRLWGPDELAGTTRCVLGLPHPNARGPRKGVADNLGAGRAQVVMSFLQSTDSPSH
jgi:hypothetical protein